MRTFRLKPASQFVELCVEHGGSHFEHFYRSVSKKIKFLILKFSINFINELPDFLATLYYELLQHMVSQDG
jgi:hypothetical protein